MFDFDVGAKAEVEVEVLVSKSNQCLHGAKFFVPCDIFLGLPPRSTRGSLCVLLPQRFNMHVS